MDGLKRSGGQGRIRTFEGDSRQIYSLIPLTAREPTHIKCWSWRRASNPRPADYKSAALPTELRQQSVLFNSTKFV